MANEIRVCIDRSPPPKTPGERMALITGNKWQSRDQIVNTFMDGDAALWERVKRHAKTWQRYARLNLFFRQDPNADIRISFRQKGSWSHIGTACHNVPSDEPTMNFGWLRADSSEDEVQRVVLHEFGHALACIHEHNHPLVGIRWNKKAVYNYFSGPPNNWTKEQIEHNLFEHYDRSLTDYSKMDPASIMMYPIDRRFTEDGFEVGWNRELSEMDQEFIAQMYP